MQTQIQTPLPLTQISVPTTILCQIKKNKTPLNKQNPKQHKGKKKTISKLNKNKWKMCYHQEEGAASLIHWRPKVPRIKFFRKVIEIINNRLQLAEVY